MGKKIFCLILLYNSLFFPPNYFFKFQFVELKLSDLKFTTRTAKALLKEISSYKYSKSLTENCLYLKNRFLN